MKSEIKKGAVLGYINLASTVLVTFLYTPFMLGMLGQSEYGLYSLVTSVVAYLSVLDMGFGNAMIRYVSKSLAREEKEKEKSINGMFFVLYCIIGVVALAIGLVLFLNVNNLFSKSLTPMELEKAKIIMAILIFTVAINFPMSVFSSYMSAHEKFSILRILTIIKTLSVPLTMLPLLYGGYKSIAMVIVTCVYNILYHVITVIYCKKKLHMKMSLDTKKFDKSLMKEIGFYSFWIFLNLIVDSIYKNTDQVILGSVCGTVAVSVYAVATKITHMNSTCSTTISGLFLPKVSKMLEKEDADKKLSDLFIKISRIQMYIMFLILSGFIVYGKVFFKYWVGNKIGDGYIDAYYIVLLLIVPAVVPLTQNVAISVIQAKNIHQFRSVLYIIIAILNIIVSIPLARLYQGIGAAIGTALANIIGQIITMNIFYYKKAKLDIPSYWKRFISFGIPIAIISAINMYILGQINVNLKIMIIGIISFTIVYFIVSYIWMNEEERNYIKNIFKFIKRKVIRS